MSRADRRRCARASTKEAARDRGIVVISHEGSDLKNVDYDIEAFDNKAYGEAQMKELAKLMGEEGRITPQQSARSFSLPHGMG